MDALIILILATLHNVYQIITVYTLNIYNYICQFFPSKLGQGWRAEISLLS